jgi:dipeptidyl aminopeptidase/acylaminoacyl peptidase
MPIPILLGARSNRAVVFALTLASAGLTPAAAQPASPPAPAFTLAQVKSFPFPTELTAAATGSRIAWAFNEQGRRNVWVAEAPGWTPRRLTAYDTDDAQEITSLSISPDGAHVVFVRGGDHGSNWDDGLPVNPIGMPVPPSVEVWTVPFAGGEPKSLGEGDAPAISPRADVVALERARQIWLAPIDGSAPARRALDLRGTNGDVQWAPDGSRFAFVSNRGTHSLIGIYKDAATPIAWIAPSTSRDGSPRWSPEGTRLAFVRRPGQGGPAEPVLEQRHQPWAIWTVDAATGDAKQLWRAPETLRGSVPTTHGGTNLHWAAGGRIVFLSYADGWPHLYSVAENGGEPLLLTPGNFMAEYIRMSPDRRHMVFAANAGDTDGDLHRRHILRVPVDRTAAEVLTPGTGLEWTPIVTGDRQWVAYLSATPQRPPLPAVRPVAGGPSRLLAEDRLPKDFPAAQLVTPRAVSYTAEDGITVHAQLFERPGGSAKRPAIVYVHGGPPRQMLLGWHYSDYYSNAYAMNQYLASRGFVVLSVNYRLGIGYGYEFHRPPGAGAQGAAEYRDIKAAGLYLRSLPQVDPARVGIYGGSYGGFLTALALGRNSDIFAAGVDIHGVHDFTSGDSGAGSALQAAMQRGSARFEATDRDKAQEIAWQSSPVSSVGTWTSPVLLIHGDDDRNVRFSQTVDLARRLAKQGVPFEELIIPDDTHHWMRFANQLRVNAATAAFFEKLFGAK